MRSSDAARGGTFAAAVTIALAILTAVFAVRPVNDFDVWFHLAAGRLMWATHAWPAVNTFAWTAPDHPWIDLHWVFQLALYGMYSLAGPNGCIAIVVALLGATVTVLYALARRFVPPAPAALLVATAVVVSHPRFVPRPEMVSFVLFATYLFVLERSPHDRGRWLWALVPLQVLWTNSQGIFAIGLALIGCYWLGATLALLPLPRGWRAESGRTPADWRALTAVLALATAAAFLNPYGLRGVLFPLELLPRVTQSSIFALRIGEFRGPLASGYAPPLAYGWIALLVLTGLSFLVNARRLHLGRLLATLVFGYLSTQTLRNVALFAWLAAPMIAANAATFVRGGRDAAAMPTGFASRRWQTVANAAVALVLLLLAASFVSNRLPRALGSEHAFGLGVSPLRFSTEAVAFTRAVGIGGRPFNCLALGGSLLWQGAPETPVFVDGRLEAYPEAVFADYFRVMDDPRTWPALVAKYHPDFVIIYHIWPNRLSLVRYLAAGNGWTIVYYDEGVSIFLPVDEAHAELVRTARARFGEIVTARRAQPLPPRSSWDTMVLPLEEFWRLQSYGDLLRTLQQWDDAAAVYQRALAIVPDDADVRFSLGITYWYAGKTSQATREWRDVLRRDPEHEPTRRALREVGAEPSS